MDYPYFISDYYMVKDMVSYNVQISSRFIYIDTLKAGVDYILE
jgi:hypothetical protein